MPFTLYEDEELYRISYVGRGFDTTRIPREFMNGDVSNVI